MWKAAAPQYGRPLLRDLIEADDVLNGFDCSSSQAARPTDETAFDSDIVASMPGTVLLRESLFYPGGGGQPADHDTAMDPAANGAREKLQRWTAARLGGGWLLRRDQLVQPSISIAATCGNVRAHAPCRGMVSG